MKLFQDFGHEVVFLIGDFTGLVGDPSGVNETRPVLTEDQLKENAINLLFFFIKKLKLNSINLNQSQVNKPYRKILDLNFQKIKDQLMQLAEHPYRQHLLEFHQFL